jgi:hypothetical protein
LVDTTGVVAGSAVMSPLTSGMWLDDSGNNELSLAILHDHFSNTHLDHAFEGAGLLRSNTDAHRSSSRGRGSMASVELISRARLFGVQFPSGVEVVEVQDRVEYHEITTDGLTPIDRVVREQHDVSFPHRHIDHDRPLRDIGAAIEKP